MSTLDLIILAGWLLLTLVAGTYFSRRASKSTESFFVGDRSLPWWVVGTSMVATTFAADTPLVVSGWVAAKGIGENWIWWTFGLSGIFAVFLYARLWRRAEVLTDQELVELRYGPRAAWLRGAKAIWFGGFMNLLVVAWVMKAMTKVFRVVLELPEGATLASQGWIGGNLPVDVAIVLVLFVLAVGYTASSGLYGVVATDVVQFVVAMVAAVVLAWLAWVEVGGIAGMQAGFATHGFDWEKTTAMLPTDDLTADGQTTRIGLLIAFVWWTQRNVDGGGYLAQRLFAAKDDRHALYAYLWFTVAHICVRPWPWIIVGLAGMALIGPVEDPEAYYPMMMLRLLPAGAFGLMLASFLAAFMSTIDTQLNYGASVVVNDVYRRFVRTDASEAHYVAASRIAVLALAVLGAALSFAVDDIGFAWKLAISVTAGLGTVYIARWYWWRVSEWSEFSAMLTAAACTGLLSLTPVKNALAGLPEGWLEFPFTALATAAVVVAVWLTVTWLTPAVRPEVLREFYRKVRPGGRGWAPVAHDMDGFADDGPNGWTALGIVGGVAAVYGSLFATGHLLLGHYGTGFLALVIAIAGTALAGVSITRAIGPVPSAAKRTN